jgi:hypothetical protein
MAIDSVEPKSKPLTAAPMIPTTIAKAIIEIQRTLKPLLKSAENEVFNSSYVPLEEVTMKAHELLASRGIGVTQPMVTDEHGHAALETMLFTGSGQAFSRTTKIALSMNNVNPQSHGSAITYTRRYALMAILGLTSKGEDDDGNKASNAMLPVTQEQLDEMKMLLSLIPWPQEQIQRAIKTFKTKDAADMGLDKYRKLVSEKKRDLESKSNAIEVKSGDDTEAPVSDEPTDFDPTSERGFKARLKALKLTSPSYENKVIGIAADVPFLSKVMMKPERIQGLDTFLKALESGVKNLPAEFYAPTAEPRTVDEDVA